MSYEQIVLKAMSYGLTKECAEEFAMKMHLQGADKNPALIENALRIHIAKINK